MTYSTPVGGRFGQALDVVQWGTTKTGAPEAVAVSDNMAGQIDTLHFRIHEGTHFQYNSFDTLGAGATVDWLIRTPADRETHILFDMLSTLRAEAYFYEGAVATAGSAATPFNSNRLATSSLVQGSLLKNPTISATGTLLGKRSWGSGTNPGNAFPGSLNHGRELILKKNKTYLLRVISRGASNVITYLFDWYNVIE